MPCCERCIRLPQPARNLGRLTGVSRGCVPEGAGLKCLLFVLYFIDARKWASATETAIREGRYFKTAESKRHTLAESIDRYTTEVLPTKRPSTIYNQKYHFRWWKDQLGHYVLADISPPLLVEYRAKLAKGEGRPRGSATTNRYMAALGHVLSTAVKQWYWLEENPMRKINKLKEPKGRVRYLNDDERQRLLKACMESRNRYLHTITVLALSTGARKMELLNLTWHDVDFQRRVIILQDTKNGERRTLPMSGYALSLMRQHNKARPINSEFVFPNRTGNKPLSIRDAFDNAVKRAGINDLRFHDLRHCCGSYLAMNGATLAEIAAVLGHKSYDMVKRYSHLSEQHTALIVERMNTAIFGGGVDKLG